MPVSNRYTSGRSLHALDPMYYLNVYTILEEPLPCRE
jgi:hypothetical protein